ncbi:3-hydroxyisobutyrate dehydrogenase [Kitasatospora sp. MAA4]|uniref:NAD(P)-dependent oxidoreductase n=1 Tax=Kitasatospora sp. MAA4 TaxID=3035093 RepID=UPI002472EB20|nr:NAD(P)-dependent oxidoreductase [Kitasatospora sp. MAA4]MDH6136862.1 3-hydroxyisobutyrate dehydrogenase [Kitasatospora sp. MAA4]
MNLLSVGFIGLGVMGEPMALNLLKAGTPLLVWNRTTARTRTLAAAGAEVAPDAASVFARSEAVILMLADEPGVDAVLGRGTPAFAERVAERTIINMGTFAPTYSQELAARIRAAGGRYVEAPVSGSSTQAAAAELVGLLAGEPAAVEAVRPLLEPMFRELTFCGPVPNGLLMKLAVNTFLITQVTGLAESFQFARRQGLDLDQLVSVLGAGPLASATMRLKAPKLAGEEFSVQASITDSQKVARLITDAAAAAGIAAPLLDVCRALFAETAQLGYAHADMSAVVKAIEVRGSRAIGGQTDW